MNTNISNTSYLIENNEQTIETRKSDFHVSVIFGARSIG